MAANITAAAKLDWIDGIMTTCKFRLMVDVAMNRAQYACHKAGIGLTAMDYGAGEAHFSRNMPIGRLTRGVVKELS